MCEKRSVCDGECEQGMSDEWVLWLNGAEWGWNFTHSAEACRMGLNGAEYIGRGYYSAVFSPI